MWLVNDKRQAGVTPLARALAGAPTEDSVFARQRRGAVREMLAALEHATVGGRHHLMGKVLGLLGQDASGSHGRLSEPQRRAIATSLDALAREAARRAPDEAAFVHQASQLVDTLGAA